MAPGSAEKIERGKGAVSDDDDWPIRQPATDLLDHLARPVGELFVPLALAA
jgi:hypothetical protein